MDDSQQRQARFLAHAAHATRSRFPRVGGFFVWLGHDAFPCAVSLALLDAEGRPKPVAEALRGVFTTQARGGSPEPGVGPVAATS